MNKTVQYKSLQHYCTTPTDDLLDELATRFSVSATDTHYGQYVFVDNDAPVLAVCHLDTVADWEVFKYVDKDGKMVYKFIAGHINYQEHYLNSRKKHKRMGVPTMYTASHVVQSIALDDRLGLYMILDILPAMGVKMDYLFTTNEERGQSTAQGFYTSKQYNWVCQFDRRGFDPVLYQYDSPELRQLLLASGYRIARGTYSDIVDLEQLGCKAINFGIGYDYEHSNRCCASMESVQALGRQFTKFYCANRDTFLNHQPDYSHLYYLADNNPNDDGYTADEWTKLYKADNHPTNNAYFKDYADWDDTNDTAKTAFDMGELACDFCGDVATHVVKLDGDYYLCEYCYQDLRPDTWDKNDLDDNRRFIFHR